MNEICDLLDTYNGRDKVVRLACYLCKYWGCVKQHEGLLRASSQLSATRTVLRLFDDLPMLKYSMEYGLGKHEVDRTSSVLGVICNAVDQLFLPIEKLCWLGEMGIIRLTEKQATNLDTANTICWVTSLYITLVRCMKQLKLTRAQKCAEIKTPELQRQLITRHCFEAITCIKLCIDLTHAVNCLPQGWLWGGKIDGKTVGAIASISSVIGLGMHFAKRKYL